MNIFSFSPFGYEGNLVTVEVDLRRGIPAVDIVGLADGAIKESRERMKVAIKNSGFDFPMERVLISLSPADLKKEGAGFDLALALAVLKESQKSNSKNAFSQDNNGADENILVMGELELSGTIRPVKAIHAAVATAAKSGIFKCIVSSANAAEAREVSGMKVFGAENLTEAYESLSKPELFLKISDEEKKSFIPSDSILIDGIPFPPERDDFNFSSFSGQKPLLRAMQIAAAGGHNMLAFGPPGCGKTLALSHFAELLPLLTFEESQASTRIHSIAGLLNPSEPLMRIPPFRMPHQTASIEGICGGGTNCRPGEISLAHNGVLFFDEAAEFKSSVLQMMRVPIENGKITLSRAGRSTVYPARFQLLLATNPCPCGNYGSENRICLCSGKSIAQYWRKFSGPLLDRIDIRLQVDNDSENNRISQKHPCETCTEQENCKNCEKVSDFNDSNDGESFALESVTTSKLRIPIARATKIQRARQGKKNALLTPQEIFMYCRLCQNEQLFFDREIKKNDFSQRAISSILKLSRTISDMEESEKISLESLEEAIFLRKNRGSLEILSDAG